LAKETYFSRASLEFLEELKAHNDRDWFLANKQRYEEQVRDPFLRLIADLAPGFIKAQAPFVADPDPNRGSMMRIYRDIRFSKDKSPYKTFIAAHFHHARAKKESAATGLYLRIAPGSSVAGGGIWQPDPQTLKKIRDAIGKDSKAWQKVTAGLRVGPMCSMAGESLKKPPAGYDEGHPCIEDIKRKDFAVSATLTDEEVCSPGLKDLLLKRYTASLPFAQFLSKAIGLG